MASTNLKPHSCTHCRRSVIDFKKWREDDRTYPKSVRVIDITFAEICQAAIDECTLSQYILGDQNQYDFADPQNIALFVKAPGIGVGFQIDRIECFGWWDKTKNISYGAVCDGFQLCNNSGQSYSSYI